MSNLPALVGKDGKKVRRKSVRPPVMAAIHLIVEEGISINDAAQRVGYNPISLGVALKKPHVLAAKAAVKRAWLASETDKAWLTVTSLAQSAGSEDVRLKASKVLLEASGELGSQDAERKGPASLVQINIAHQPAIGAQPSPHQLPGVIEWQAPLRVGGNTSNSVVVGRDDGEDNQP